jgi:hypothetical protein
MEMDCITGHCLCSDTGDLTPSAFNAWIALKAGVEVVRCRLPAMTMMGLEVEGVLKRRAWIWVG